MSQAEGTLLDKLFERRNRERSSQEKKKIVIREEDATLEHNRQGTMRWYLHPDSDDACIKSLVVYRYEMPPGSHTGKQRVQGNLAAYCISGYGHVIVDGVSHEWEAGDVIGLPPMREGHELQLFNDSQGEARVIFAQPNFMAIYGIDFGCGFEQLEDASSESATS